MPVLRYLPPSSLLPKSLGLGDGDEFEGLALGAPLRLGARLRLGPPPALMVGSGNESIRLCSLDTSDSRFFCQAPSSANC